MEIGTADSTESARQQNFSRFNFRGLHVSNRRSSAPWIRTALIEYLSLQSFVRVGSCEEAPGVIVEENTLRIKPTAHLYELSVARVDPLQVLPIK